METRSEERKEESVWETEAEKKGEYISTRTMANLAS